MTFGYSTNAFTKFDLFEALEKIAALGFHGVEIMCDKPHLYPPEFDESEMARLKSIIEGLGLKITNLNSFTLFAVGDTYLPSWIEPDQKRRDIRVRHTLECLKTAKYLGCANISVPPGGPLNGIPRDEALFLFHKELDRVIPIAESLGVRILIEPEPGLLLENSAQFKSFIKDIESPFVGLNFDMGHFYCVGEEPEQAFEDLFQWIGHVHIEDIAPSRVHNHLIAGHGCLPFPKIFSAMSKAGYKGDISLELYPYVDMPEKAGRESLEHLLPILRDSGLNMELPDL